jgi:acyl-CoA synthetase (AMP-forming)/AMP-acid ligase II
VPVTHGAMQVYPLTLHTFLEHAATWHPKGQVVTGRQDGHVDRIGYADLHRRSLGVSGVLHRQGVRAGDTVATLAWNTQAHVEVWYAVMGMGAVCHTLNPRLTAEQLAAMVAQSRPVVLVASADLEPLAREIVRTTPSIARLFLIDGLDERSTNALEALIAEAPTDVSWGDVDETSPCGLCFTSGTTGAPKGVTYTHRSSFLHTLRLLQVDGMAISARDSVLVAVPMFHANAWGLPFAAPAAGARLVLPGRSLDGAHLAALIAGEGVTVAVGVPTIWLALVEHVERNGDALPTLERIIVGGSPLSPALMERIERRLNVIVQTSWGMTELSPAGTVTPRHASRAAHRSGRPPIGVDLRLTDADGDPLPEQRGVEGHLRVRGDAALARYYGDDQPATDASGWLPTGDLARIDEDGHLIITGRAKDLIKSGGEWINPAEIEALVSRVPDVALVAVVGRPDVKWVLVVELRDAAMVDDASLLEPLRGKVPTWWIPGDIVRVPRMPLSPAGKIDKRGLRTSLDTHD